jgi:hypothetical protein
VDRTKQEQRFRTRLQHHVLGCNSGGEESSNSYCQSRFPSGRIDEAASARNLTKLTGPAKVKHPIGVLKRLFRFVKIRYRGSPRNVHRLEVTPARTGLFMLRRRLLLKE